jgi:hypothetical protein
LTDEEHQFVKTGNPKIYLEYKYLPDSLSLDPEPAFLAEYRSGYGSRILMTKNGGKNLRLKKKFDSAQREKTIINTIMIWGILDR